MTFDPQSLFIVTTYLLFAVLGLTVLTLVAFVFFGTSFFKRLTLLDTELERRKREAHFAAEAILERARKEARETVGRANEKASEVVHRAETFSRESEHHFRKTLENFSHEGVERLRHISEEVISGYQTLTDEARHVYLKSVETMAEATGAETRKGVLAIQKSIEEQISQVHREVDLRLREWHAAARKEIEAYRKEEFQRTEESLYKILVSVSREVLGKAIDLETHQELVKRSLEEAKKENFFR